MSSAVTAASSSSSSLSTKPCYNSDCKELRPDRSRKGWRLRTGDFAELCDRCASAYEEGRFCETFHLNASGWRCCESCGKRVHCGCIVSAHAFTLLDPGGIECMTCARKNVILPLNPVWPPSLLFHSALPDRLKDLSVKNWSQLAGSGPVPWRQAPSMFNSSLPSGELHHRAPYEVDISAALNKLNTSERLPISLEKRKNEDFSERFSNGSLRQCGQDLCENGTAGGINCEDKPSSCSSIPQQSSFVKEDTCTTQYGLNVPYAPPNEPSTRSRMSGTHLRPTPPSPLPKQVHTNLQNGADPSSETQLRNGRPRGDSRGRNYLLPRYWPRFTDQELQQISVDSNSVITPLFEKMLSASDAGRIGRLVLPKKCAEAYFPSISQPEGLPLKVQDAKGKEWIFQFRFWPNNNSRMYVLEGVTPCIQSMQLQAGDIVTFSRLEPEGKLVMGFRKASTAADQENETNKTKNGAPAHGDVSNIKVKAELADPNSWTKVDKSGYIAKEVLGVKPSISRKRKNSTLGSKSKRLRIENEDMIELKITWEEAQGLLRPPPNQLPNIVVIEGFEFEEYEDAPVLGKPTIIPPDNTCERIQWIQCEDCLKWRKLPASALLPSKWICSDNSWDPERSFCSAAQELSTEKLEELLSPSNSAAVQKMKAAKLEPDNVEALEGLDTLANLAILEEGEASQAPGQATTKHPRHRPGCSCIVCIQPPSGKGPKHKQTCTCNVCLTVKRRFQTLMLRREKKQSEKEAETTRQRHQFQDEMFLDRSMDDESLTFSNTGPSKLIVEGKMTDGSDEDPNRNKPSTSPFKGQIDLNMQPEREEELSPGSDSGSMMKVLQDTGDRFLEQQRSNSGGAGSSSSDPLEPGGEREHRVENSSNVIDLGSSNLDADKDHPGTLSFNASASMSATG
ncbi:B3 domain-containing protein Os07g0563300-like isoform X1 [Cucurbita pepo subsp. pepo]|uniref:B3 domain-containing protein Os07g0563300-like isoform X1 n=1 Tax=Cucurbita pepo subsp. pepo TaxID=3664 RepID=UPI000C9D50C4|nr:B3 domain-containing protein Os07g0563300-like isoform X1 [Cucurbita pepo subsp. pepo]